MAKREPGERRKEILQTLAHMLEDPKGQKITTALLASKLDVSEAALYRHFASKAQMYEGLIEFIEETVFSLVNKIQAEEIQGIKQVEGIVSMLLSFAQKNQGMTRVLIGDVLVNEDDRLQARMNQFMTGWRRRCAKVHDSPPPTAHCTPRSTRPPTPTRSCRSSSAAGTSSPNRASSVRRRSIWRRAGAYLPDECGMSAATFDAVDAQLAAYNARDLEAFLACYHADCAIDRKSVV